jgi:protein-tyrosine phosphatase
VIAEDYAMTATCLDARWIAEHRAAVEARGVSWESYRAYLDCAPSLMLGTLAYLEERYGGIEPYLARLGLSALEIGQLRDSLVE